MNSVNPKRNNIPSTNDGTLEVRKAEAADAMAICAFRQSECRERSAGGLEQDYPSLLKSMSQSARTHWLARKVTQNPNSPMRVEEIEGVLVLDHEQAHGISRLGDVRLRETEKKRMVFDCLLAPALEDATARNLGKFIYITARCASLETVCWALDHGFQAVGRFPGARTSDTIGVNPILVRLEPDNLASQSKGSTQRRAPVSLHPAISALAAIALPPLGYAVPPMSKSMDTEAFGLEMPKLEFLSAPEFVRHRFTSVMEKRFLASGFYPFYEPNALICDPELSCEVFLHVASGFGTIIGEHVQRTLDYANLLSRVTALLDCQGVRFIQALCLAADSEGIGAFLEAGFLPCAYMPSLQKHGKWRMDCVMLCYSFEKEKPLPDSAIEEFLEVDRALQQTREWWGI
jgi:hypothetical protein